MSPTIEIENIDHINLLGLMIGRMIERNLAIPSTARKIASLKGSIGITAGKMTVTVEFQSGKIRVRNGLISPLRSSIQGSLSELLKVSLGKNPAVSLLGGGVKIKGNPLFALKIMPLIRAVDRG